MPASNTTVSYIYATCLYAACEGLPLWNPGLCDLGDVGFVRQGTFHKIYNVSQDLQAIPFNPASNLDAARRTQADPLNSATNVIQSGSGNHVALSNALEGSDTISEGGSPLTVPAGLPGLSNARFPSNSPPPSSRRSSLTKYFPRHSSPSNPAPETIPPHPLHLEAEVPHTFEMGPRMSSNIEKVGASIGGNVHAAGIPVGATLTFESSGGDGALLVARDPVERHLLLHVGVLKTYLKAHRRYIYERFGPAEDIEMDDIILVYGKDCSSDWSVAVDMASSAGTRIEFEFFTAAKVGTWGNWKTTCSVSQSGPYRSMDESHRDNSHQMDVDSPNEVEPAPSNAASSNPFGNLSATANLTDGTFSIQSNLNPQTGTQNGDSHPIESAPMPKMPNVRWNGQVGADEVNQSIVLRRITARSRLGLNMFPPSLRASAGPRNDGPGGPPPSGNGEMSSESGQRVADDSGDPLDMVHEYILSHANASRASVSIASDHDASLLCKRVLQERWPHIDRRKKDLKMFRRCIWEMADQLTMIIIDRDNVATLYFPHEKGMQDGAFLSRSPPASVRPPLFRTPSSPGSPSERRTRTRTSRVYSVTPTCA